MKHVANNQRGLAEIVGTLMLVVIVVAAATAFSFFVAAYQKQVQAEETIAHDKSLEDLKILALAPTIAGSPPMLTALTIELASSDVNPTVVDGMALNGNAVVSYDVAIYTGGPSASGCLNGNPAVTPNPSCILTIPAESQAFLTLSFTSSFVSPPTLPEDSALNFDIFTSLGNEFVETFVPPVAVATVAFIGAGNSSYPILDGSASFQPESADNSTIDQWSWTLSCTNDSVPTSSCAPDYASGPYFGEDHELGSPLSTDPSYSDTYSITLTVTNSDLLVGSVTIQYQSPG